MLTLTDFSKTRATSGPLCIILLLLTFRYIIVVNAACASGWTSVCGSYGNDCVTCTGSGCSNGNCRCCPPATTTTTTSSPSIVTSTTTTPSPPTVSSTTTTPSPSTTSSPATTPSPSTVSTAITTPSPSTVTSPTTASLTTATSSTTAAGGSTTTSGGGTTSSAVNTTCFCNCTKYNEFVSRLYNTPFENMTEEEQSATIAVRVEELRVKLTVPTDSLSSTVRRKTSAEDDRVASKSIGLILGIGLLCVMIGSVVISDLRVFYHHIRYGPENTLHK